MASEAVSEGARAAMQIIEKCFSVYRTADKNLDRVFPIMNAVASVQQPIELVASELERDLVADQLLERVERVLSEALEFVDFYGGKGASLRLLRHETIAESFDRIIRKFQLIVREAADLIVARAPRVAAPLPAGRRSGSLTRRSTSVARPTRSLDTVLTCVQCGKDYTQRKNGKGKCRYHPLAPSMVPNASWAREYRCCGKEYGNDAEQAKIKPCHSGQHRADHHTEYPYERYWGFAYASASQARDTWLELVHEDYEDDRDKVVQVGQIHDTKEMFIQVLSGNTMRFYALYDVDSFAQVVLECPDPADSTVPAVDVLVDKSTYASSSHAGAHDAAPVGKGLAWFARVWWRIIDGNIVGMSISVKPYSSDVPHVAAMTLVQGKSCALPGRGYDVQLARMPMLDPSGPEVKAPPAHTAPRPELKSERTGEVELPASLFVRHPDPANDLPMLGNLKLRVRPARPASVNHVVYRDGFDTWAMPLMVMNLDTADVELVAVSVHLQLKRMGDWIPCDSMHLLRPGSLPADDSPVADVARFPDKQSLQLLPLSLSGRKAQQVEIVTSFAHASTQGARGPWDRRAFLAKEGPVRLRFTFESLDGITASAQFDWVNPPLELPEQGPNDDWFVVCDDVATYQRFYVRMNRTASQTSAYPDHVEMGGDWADERQLHAAVYQARRSDSDAVCISSRYVCADHVCLDILVDRRMHAAYALRATLKSSTGSVVEHYLFNPIGLETVLSPVNGYPRAAGDATAIGAAVPATRPRRSTVTVHCQGYLDKFSNRGLLKRWQRRFFVLSRDALTYRLAEIDTSGSRGVVKLSLIQAVAEYAQVPFGFQVVTPERTYYLRAESEEDRRTWMNSISALL